MNKDIIITENTNSFSIIKRLLEENKALYFHYNLMGIGDKLRITKSNKLSFLDSQNKRVYLTLKQFNKYNLYCNFWDIITIEGEN